MQGSAHAGRGGARWLVALVPYFWLALFFAVPFLIVLKISLSQTAIAQPPYLPVFDPAQGAAALKAAFAALSLDNFRLLVSDDLYVLSYLRSLVVAAVSSFVVVVHLPVAINPAIVAAMVPPIVLLATASGQNPAVYGLPVVFTASCAFLLPLDAVPLVTYGKGYYRMFDMLLPGAIISVAWVAVMTAVMLLIGPAVGLM